MWNKMWNKDSCSSSLWTTHSKPLAECDLDQPISIGKLYLSRRELNAWIAVCIYKRLPEEEYAKFVSHMPETFLEFIQDFIWKYSPITFDDNEKDYYHEIIVQLLDKYFVDNSLLESEVKFTKLLNDIRFGYVNESLLQDRIVPFGFVLDDPQTKLVMSASKANHKRFVQQLVRHYHFTLYDSLVETEYPQNFKGLLWYCGRWSASEWWFNFADTEWLILSYGTISKLPNNY